jgi:hypothetical protein
MSNFGNYEVCSGCRDFIIVSKKILKDGNQYHPRCVPSLKDDEDLKLALQLSQRDLGLKILHTRWQRRIKKYENYQQTKEFIKARRKYVEHNLNVKNAYQAWRQAADNLIQSAREPNSVSAREPTPVQPQEPAQMLESKPLKALVLKEINPTGNSGK